MGLIKTAAKVAVASSVHGRVQRRQQQRWAEQDQRAASTTPEPTLSNDPLVGQLALLTQLGELRDAGVLTDDEFAAKKATILAAEQR
jgi:hypothetical protein